MVGEFSLSLVDKAVLALADATEPGIVDAFYGHRILRVFSKLEPGGDLRSALPISLTWAAVAVVMGQTYWLPAPTRFADTAYWTGKLQTDSMGLASVKVRLPDNLTTWVADARGITTDSRVGGAVLELVSSKDLLIRPQLPRFVVAGDLLSVNAIVNNNSSKNLSVSVDVNLNSAELLEGEQLLKVVDDPCQGAGGGWMARANSTWQRMLRPGSLPTQVICKT